MNIETKLNIGDGAWFMCENKTCCEPVVEIDINVITQGIGQMVVVDIAYTVGHDYPADKYPETEVFKTKKELLDSL